MRKIILTGAVLAMLTSAAPMVHAQIDTDVQKALDEKANKKDYDAKIQELEGKVEKANGLGDKIDNIGNALNDYKTQNDEKVNKKIDETQLDKKLDTHRQTILGDVDGKITLAKKDLKADAETQFEAQRRVLTDLNAVVNGADGNGGLKKVVGKDETEGLQKAVKENKKLLVGADGNGGLQKDVENNKKILVGDDGNGGLKGDIKKLQDAVGDNNSGLQKEVNTIKTNAEAQRTSSLQIKDIAENNKKLLVGADGNGGLKNDVDGLKNDVEDNKNKITQADTKAESAKDESAAASRLALEVKQKIDAMANGQNDVKKDIAELGGRIDVTGAMSAALAGLKPLQYDPMAPTQVMGSVSTYEGQQAYALGLAHFTSEDLMVHGGVSFTNSHKYMANVGVTYKFGHSAEKSMIPMRYQAGPISSIYVMQKENEMMREKMAQQEERIAQLEEMIMNMKK